MNFNHNPNIITINQQINIELIRNQHSNSNPIREFSYGFESYYYRSPKNKNYQKSFGAEAEADIGVTRGGGTARYSSPLS